MQTFDKSFCGNDALKKQMKNENKMNVTSLMFVDNSVFSMKMTSLIAPLTAKRKCHEDCTAGSQSALVSDVTRPPPPSGLKKNIDARGQMW